MAPAARPAPSVTFEEFTHTGPCLEELEGFREAKIIQRLWSDQDQADYLVWEDKLKRGKEVPAPSKLQRSFIYTRGKPVKKRGRHHVT